MENEKHVPLISIVTIVYNGEGFLEETIKSVISQTYENIEYIIIDGGSADSTVDIIKRYDAYINYWISEPDKGIYDAMNKGMGVANGDFVNFMNGGDIFYDTKSVANIARNIQNFKEIYFGRGVVMSGHNRWIRPHQKTVTYEEISEWLKKETPVHQALFFPKHIYKTEKFDLRYSIFADAEHHLRVQKKANYIFVDTIVCTFFLGGISSRYTSYQNVWQMTKEAINIGKRHHRMLHSLKRVVVYHIKYLMVQLFGEENFIQILKQTKHLGGI